MEVFGSRYRARSMLNQMTGLLESPAPEQAEVAGFIEPSALEG
jgi:hypothetical protein